jgi:hypothetical protein
MKNTRKIKEKIKEKNRLNILKININNIYPINVLSFIR